MQLLNYKMLYLLFVALVVLVPLYVFAMHRTHRMLRKFAELSLLQKIGDSASLSRRITRALFLLAAFVAIVIALAEPVSNPRPRKVHRKGRDVAILLDVSRSMLAEDLRPNRLKRAKLAIGDLLDVLEGDRIALVTFAGSSSVKCPLTTDYAFMRLALSEVSTQSTFKGGTLIGDAIRKATNEVFDPQLDKYKDIILITDGDDHESFPVQAAQAAAEQNIRIIAIGLGDPDTGSRIPIIGPDGKKTFLKDKEGNEVWTRLGGAGGDTLREISLATPNGKYLPVKTGTFNLDEIYQGLVAAAQKRELESTTAMQYDQQFQWFLALAIGILICESLIGERKTTG